MAQATETQAILVSHGSPSDPDGQQAQIARLAGRVARLLPGWRVRGATLAAKGAFETAMAQLANPLICPLFMAPGWFVDSLIPARLGDAPARLLPPLGIDPRLPGLVRDEAGAALTAQGLSATDTTLVIAAHGSPSHRQSAAAVPLRRSPGHPDATARCGSASSRNPRSCVRRPASRAPRSAFRSLPSRPGMSATISRRPCPRPASAGRCFRP
ncbi:MAG: hypothetical protein R3D85_07660 [Paracoccaceae bacterium]